MPYLLDTDSLSILQRQSDAASPVLQQRLSQQPPDSVFASIVSFEEQVRGWMAELNRLSRADRLLRAYRQLELLLRYYSAANLLSFDQAALDQFNELRRRRVRVGTMDLRIAAIALATGSTVVSRNVRDFRRVPGLAVENWTR